MVTLFAMWFDVRGRPTIAGRGTRQQFALCQTCDTVTPVDDAVDVAPPCAVCQPSEVPL